MQPPFFYSDQENTTGLEDKQETIEQLGWQQQTVAPHLPSSSPHYSKNSNVSTTPPPTKKEINNYFCDICPMHWQLSEAPYFIHKCPICSITLFCTHLLKEHMRGIHGWFTVQRRFHH